ncbi:MAG TPA: alpha/beta fold hydrolase [Gemmataceae bacterium]|nr:alpha/beta fold hydrolase [Gemmataceae bacterium]
MLSARPPSLAPTTRAWLGALVCALALAPAGCSYGISVRRASNTDLSTAWRDSIVESSDLSPRTRQTLHRWDLDSHYDHEPLDAYARLQAAAANDPQPDVLFALGEMSYLFGRRAEKDENNEACVYYYLCAGYAYHYLFDEPAAVGNNPYDPRFRLACELYNMGLAKCIRAAQRTGRLDPRQQMHLPTPDGQGFTLSVVHHGFPWRPEEFGTLLFSADYEVVGLTNHYHGYGLGAALIGTRVADSPDNNAAPGGRPSALRYPREVSFPITAFFRFEGSVADLGARRAGRLELYNPFAIQTVDVGTRTIPLETDLTTPLAYFLSRTDLDGIEYTGLLQADKVQDRAGIYMFEPYQPGKIPVVMVHGFLSSPLTWTTLFNDLRADPVLREHFQFWFYLYPTGNPYLATAADLRETLVRLRAEVDPQGRDRALDQMVFVGHSMGGLVAKLLTEDSGDDFWRLVSKQPFDQVKAHPATLAELRRLFFFEHLPCVRRVVFIATPHHGSKLAPSPPARLLAQFIRMPKALTMAAGDVAQENPQLLPGLRDGSITSNLDMLAPGAPALELLTARPRPRGVHFHSIIGDMCGKGEDATDGIVPYRSAHLDGVDSEVVVAASHWRVHQQPRTVLEVRRILLEHLQELRGQQGVAVLSPRTLPTSAN